MRGRAVRIIVAAVLAALPMWSSARAATADPGPPHVTIVSSLPLAELPELAVPMSNGIQMAVADAGGMVRGVRVDYESLDDSSGSDWSAEVANAQQAAADPSVVAYIGPANSSAAERSIPILCGAGLGMISPSNTRDGLTKYLPPEQFEPSPDSAGEPGVYYPNGCTHNYSRDIARDSVVGEVAAVRSHAMGASSAYVIQTFAADQFAYGYVAEAGALGMPVVSAEVLQGDAAPVGDIGTRVAASGADVVYLSCFQGFSPCASIVSDIRAAAPQMRIVTADVAVFDGSGASDFLSQAGSAAEGVVDVREFLAPDDYSPAATAWYARYSSEFGAVPMTDFNAAIYAYDATNAVLAAIGNARQHVDRDSVRQALMSTTGFNGLVGTWSLDADGDTTSTLLSTLTVVDGAWVDTGTASLP